ncbi:hypothetical protein N9C31_02630 [Gammaproteobacteria bacterium]|nr:hypothetical protein [Gammaproteobacteria bacterium]
MSKSDIENKIRSVIRTIRVAIKPELAIPVNEATHPINYRITRLRTQLDELKKMQANISTSIDHMNTNLEALLDELNSVDTSRDEQGEKDAPVVEEKKPKAKKAAAKKTTKDDQS